MAFDPNKFFVKSISILILFETANGFTQFNPGVERAIVQPNQQLRFSKALSARTIVKLRIGKWSCTEFSEKLGLSWSVVGSSCDDRLEKFDCRFTALNIFNFLKEGHDRRTKESTLNSKVLLC